MSQPELFQDTFYKWLEANGVKFTSLASGNNLSADLPPFAAEIDLNKLKIGVIELTNYLPRLDAHEHMHDPDSMPPGMCEFCDEERHSAEREREIDRLVAETAERRDDDG